jgi:porin
MQIVQSSPRLRTARRLLFGFAAILSLLVLPASVEAVCEIHERGIPEQVVTKIDPGGIRAALAQRGVSIEGLYVGELFGNPTGGLRQGTEYNGVLELNLAADMQKLGFWSGLCFHASGYQIHGKGITAQNLETLMPVSSFEAMPATRLFELWLEQHLWDERLAIKFGQLAADEDFIISEGGGFFLNGTWGWPSIAAENLPGGGPAYPLAAPGVRVAYHPTEQSTLLVGLYNGDPAGDCRLEDPERCNRYGLDFRLGDPPLLMAELAYRYNQEAQLPGTVKFGGWNHFGDFEHQRVDVGGRPIGITANSGRPLDHTYGFYGIVDQLIYRVPGEEVKGVGVFGRIIGAHSDRNLIDFYADAGITFTGFIASRPDDALAIGFAYTGISDLVSAFDLDSGLPVARKYEALLEMCYTMQIKPGWTLQPDFQYFWNPGGRVSDDGGTRPMKNAAVLGARTSISF